MNLRVRNSAVLVVVVLMHLPLGFAATPRGRCRHSPHAPRSALRRDPRPTAFVTTDATGGHAAASPPHRGRCWGSRAEVCAQCVRSGEWILVACGQRFGCSALRKDPPPRHPTPANKDLSATSVGPPFPECPGLGLGQRAAFPDGRSAFLAVRLGFLGIAPWLCGSPLCSA